MRSLIVTICVFAASAPTAAHAQHVVEMANARVEVRGLHHWTTGMLIDSLAVRGERLDTHACAAVLRSQLGFADASVVFYPKGWEGRTTTEYVINVVEPTDSSRVRYRTLAGVARPDNEDWREGIRLLNEENETFQQMLRAGVRFPGTVDTTSGAAGRDAILRFISSHRTDAQMRTAQWVLAHDGNPSNRTIAAALLAAFPDEDAVWVTLADALRDPHPMVRTFAGHALHGLHTSHPRIIDWTPAVATLKALLDGTNLFAYDLVLDLLTATGQPEGIRTQILADVHQGIVVEMLASIDPASRTRAHGFLTRFYEVDHGHDQNRWREFLEGR